MRLLPALALAALGLDRTVGWAPHAVAGRAPARTRLCAAARVGVIVVDHGSRREAANDALAGVAEAYAEASNMVSIVEAAHMELAAPTVADAFAACVARGATSVVCAPFFLSLGRHVQDDLPRLLAEAAAAHPGVPWILGPPLGQSPLMPRLLESSVTAALAGAGQGGSAKPANVGDALKRGDVFEYVRGGEAGRTAYGKVDAVQLVRRAKGKDGDKDARTGQGDSSKSGATSGEKAAARAKKGTEFWEHPAVFARALAPYDLDAEGRVVFEESDHVQIDPSNVVRLVDDYERHAGLYIFDAPSVKLALESGALAGAGDDDDGGDDD